jgi:hypothetical protein
MKQADLGDMFRKASKSVCTSVIVVAPDLVSLTASTSSTVKTEEDPDDPEPVDGFIQMEYSSITVVQHKYRSSNKKLPVCA